MHFEEILIVKDGSVSYGIETALIDQILRVPFVTPVVLSSPNIVGLSAVSGNIVTVFDLSMLLSSDAVELESEHTRLLTLSNGVDALLVSEVSDTVGVEARDVELIEDPQDAVIALYKYQQEIVQILDIHQLLSGVKIRSFVPIEVREGYALRSAVKQTQSSAERYLFVRMSQEHYAIAIDLLKEIIAFPSEIVPIAGSRQEILGMISLREQLLMIADLRRFFGFDDRLSDKNRVLVTEREGRTLGLVVDQILDIQMVEKGLIDVMPPNFADQKISGVIRNEDQLVSIIGAEVMDQLFSDTEQGNDASLSMKQSKVERDIAMEVIIFKLDQEEYAISIEDVVEIIDWMPVTPFVDAPLYVHGVINIRGQVVTVVSIYEWLGKPQRASAEQKIVVCQMKGYRIAFCVESVSDVMGISKTQLREEREHSTFFSHVIYLDGGKRLALLFDIHQLSHEKVAA